MAPGAVSTDEVFDGLRIRGVSKTFGVSTTVLREIDLDVHPGEMFSLVGSSGTGKSTLLRIIAGLEDLTTGRVTYNGQPLERGSVGVVFQRPILYPHLSVKDNILFPTRLRSFKSQDIDMDYYRELLVALKLENLENRKPSQLSGGQAQRVGIARALIRRAPVVLFDEPLASVDEEMSASIRTDIVRLHERYGFTGLYVTHDQNEALMLGRRVAVMDAGYLVQVDTPGRLLDYPHTLQVAKLLSAPALNLLRIEPDAGLPADCQLAVRASALYELSAEESDMRGSVLSVEVSGYRHLVGGMLYSAVLSESAVLSVASEHLGEDGLPAVSNGAEGREHPVRVSAGQTLEFFVSDVDGTYHSPGERVCLGVAPQRCFLFSEGKRFYLNVQGA